MKIAPVEERTDLQGNVYETKKTMLEAIGIDESHYYRLRQKGKTHYEALVPYKRPNARGECTSLGISYSTYQARKFRLKWEDADLFRPAQRGRRNDIELRTDHLGKVFDSTKQMCAYWEVPYRCFLREVKSGCSVQEALTIKKYRSASVDRYERTDHKGIEYASKKNMCDNYNIEVGCYNERMKVGWTKQNALSIPSTKQLRKEFINIVISSKKPYVIGTNIYFYCKCKKCGQDYLFTYENMKNHTC